MIDKKISRAELAAIICERLTTVLHDHPVLVGGAVVSIYTRGRYVSDDLDIVSYRRREQVRPLMAELGFIERGSHWEHPNTKLFVQFVNGPVMIGRKHVKEPVTLRTRAGLLPTISPLDSACDRLAAFVHYHDQQSIEQCADIVIAKKVRMADIEAWLAAEGLPENERDRVMAALRRKLRARRASARARK